LGNVENSRCTPKYETGIQVRDNPQKGEIRIIQGHGVGAVSGTEFRQNVFDMGFGRFLVDVQMRGNRLVGIPGSNQLEDVEFPGGE
jgi:hypothetical protein